MPRSVFILFVSKYSPEKSQNHLDVGDEVICRIKAFNRESRKFRIVDIEETEEDGEVRYIYKGVYIGLP